jgi:uncharacterized protein (TIGR04255 family)
MSIISKLIPIRKKHSVKEVVISVFLGNPIIKPQRFHELIKTDFKTEFQKFEPLARVQMSFKGLVGGGVESNEPSIIPNSGFKFTSFSEGETKTVLQSLNDSDRTFISYHSLNYSDWDVFLPEFCRIIGIIANYQKDLFVKAFSLHYVDEFTWVDNDNKIPVKEIFNTQSSILPKQFMESSNNIFVLTTEKTKGDFVYHERVEVGVGYKPLPQIIISHNVTRELSDFVELSELIKSSEFTKMLHLAHSHNKETLADILNAEVCKLIDLKVNNNLN